MKDAHRLILEIAGDADSLNECYLKIIEEGDAHDFDSERTNAHWLAKTRPIVEAFFRAKYLIEQMVEQGKALEALASPTPSGWAAVLMLFKLR